MNSSASNRVTCGDAQTQPFQWCIDGLAARSAFSFRFAWMILLYLVTIRLRNQNQTRNASQSEKPWRSRPPFKWVTRASMNVAKLRTSVRWGINLQFSAAFLTFSDVTQICQRGERRWREQYMSLAIFQKLLLNPSQRETTAHTMRTTCCQVVWQRLA